MTIGRSATRVDVDQRLRGFYQQFTNIINDASEFVRVMGDANHDAGWLQSIGYGVVAEASNNGLTEVQQVQAAVNQLDRIVNVIHGAASQTPPDDLLYWLRHAAGI